MLQMTRAVSLCPLLVLPALMACKKMNILQTGDAETLSWNVGDDS